MIKELGGKNWFQYKFYNQPLIAALSNLELIESEARNLQADAISSMLQEKVMLISNSMLMKLWYLVLVQS